MNLGDLRYKDLFELDGEKYQAGRAIGNGYVMCTNTKTKKVKKFHIDSEVVKVERVRE